MSTEITTLIDGIDADSLALLGYSEFQAGAVTRDVFAANVNAAREKPQFLTVLATLKASPATTVMWQMAIVAGPAAILGLVGTFVDAGVMSKEEVRGAAKIKKVDVRWWRIVADALFHVGHTAIVAEFSRRITPYDALSQGQGTCLAEGEQSLYDLGLPAECATFPAYMKAMGKSSSMSTVDDREDVWTSISGDGKHTRKNFLALGYRVDFNVTSKNAQGLQEKAAKEAAEAAKAAAEAANGSPQPTAPA